MRAAYFLENYRTRDFENDYCVLENQSMKSNLIKLTEKGLYCAEGDFTLTRGCQSEEPF